MSGPPAARYATGTELDGFTLGERIHSGAMGHIFRVTGRDSGFPMIAKVPRVGPGESGEGIINFETEAMLLPALSGPHVPRFVAVGSLSRTPYLVTEWIDGESLGQLLERGRMSASDTARVGAAVADAVHSLHLQDAIHFDLKPDNVILKADGTAVLIDFGIAFHAHFPDLLAEEQRFAAGSAPYISPEQVQRMRSDPRSDIFALGVILYEMATGELPFGEPSTMAGLRDRLWLDPVPPRVHAPDIPPWLQEIILRCLEPRPERRYQSAAHIAFDLRHPEQVAPTRRATKAAQAGVLEQARRWWLSRNAPPAPRSLPKSLVASSPIILVAVDTGNPDDERQPALRRATADLLSLSSEFRLICVSVIARAVAAERSGESGSSSGVYLEHLARLRHWVTPLGLPPKRLSLHVIESANPENALLDFAANNHVDLIVLGAPQPSERGLAWWRSAASGVTANARCSVHVVRIPERAAG
ncbi:MAG TPA: bifunctional serine/threonine-protein kinase/universal stress protein [Casimicrobiaceae bacterium]|nr:bifunctional serine/threonine-protein kinase/universal stress protein [Casimicrobiaceae bacterium]